MKMQSLRIRLMFDDPSVCQQQPSKGTMNRSWTLIEPNQHPKISDVCNNLLNKFNLTSSCPNGILLFMKGFVLPLSESTQILKDDDIVCVRRNEVAVVEAMDGEDNVMLLLENEDFDKETGGFQSETEDGEFVKVEEASSPKVTTSEKRKASTGFQSSEKKEYPSPVMDGVQDELATDENSSKKKIKPNEEGKKENGETSDKNIKDKVDGAKQASTAPDGAKKVPSRSSRRQKARRRRKREHANLSPTPTHEYAIKTSQAYNDVSLPQKRISKNIKPNEEIKKKKAETSDINIKDNVGGVKQVSTVADGAKKPTHKYANETGQACNDVSLPQERIIKKIKPNVEIKKENADTSDNKDNVGGVKQVSTVPDGAKKPTHEYANETDQAYDDVSHTQERISKKIKPNEEIKKEIAETSDNIKDNVRGVKQVSTVPDLVKKVSTRSCTWEKAKTDWRQEPAKFSHNLYNHVKPEVSINEFKQANDHPEGPLKLPAKLLYKNFVKQEEINFSCDVDSGSVPCVVKSGRTQFIPPDEDGNKRQIKSPDAAFRCNGINNNKAAQKWGLEKFSTFGRDETRETTKESSTMLTVDTQIPRIGLIDFDQLPFCSSLKEGDTIAYRVLQLSSSWTPEPSSFRVGKISYYDGDNIVLFPVPEYPIVFVKMEEGGPDTSLYKEDGSLVIKIAHLADVRSVKQSNSDAVKALSNGVNQTPHGDDTNVASNSMHNRNDAKENLSRDPRLRKLDVSELMKKDSGMKIVLQSLKR